MRISGSIVLKCFKCVPATQKYPGWRTGWHWWMMGFASAKAIINAMESTKRYWASFKLNKTWSHILIPSKTSIIHGLLNKFILYNWKYVGYFRCLIFARFSMFSICHLTSISTRHLIETIWALLCGRSRCRHSTHALAFCRRLCSSSLEALSEPDCRQLDPTRHDKHI